MTFRVIADKEISMIENIIKEIQQRKQTVSAQIETLEAETKKLDQAINALSGLVGTPAKRGRPPKQGKAVKPVQKRKMSAAGRAAIAAAVRARWAKAKAAKGASKQAAPARKHKMSAAGRAAIAAAAKARWAKIRAAKAAAQAK